MTGGQAVILGRTGNNFGAGMTNGTAWVYDAKDTLESRYNQESVAIRRLENGESNEVRALIERHVEATGSAHARGILADWDKAVTKFWRVTPTAVVELQQALAESAEGAAD
jgi:glutamate synthase domain-containing protein 3